MATLKFNRRQASVASDWRKDPKVVAARERLAELERLIPRAADRIRNDLAPRVEEAERQLSRVELEVLAGRASDADLAAAQAKALESKVAHAQAVIAAEDMQAEMAELRDKHLPALEKKARAVAHAAIQAKTIVLLKELREHLAAAVQCEGDLALLREEAASQFDSNISCEFLGTGPERRRNPNYDPSCQHAAGVPSFAYAQFDQVARMGYVTTIESRNAGTVRGIDEVLARLEGDDSKQPESV